MSAGPGLDLRARLTALISRAAVQARAIGRPVLLSAVESVRSLDALSALAAVVEVAKTQPDAAELLAAGQMFWTHPAADFAIAGVGAAATIAPTGTHRFAEADHAWRTLLANAIVDAPDGAPASSGPVLMGGFSFEPDGPRSERWRNFPSTHLVVPALLVTVDADRTFVTYSVLVAADGTPSVAPEMLCRLREILPGGAERTVSHAAEERESNEREPQLTFTGERPAAAWRALVRAAVAAIQANAFQKVVLARAVHARAREAFDALALLDHLRITHHDSYTFAYWRDECAFVGASPERLVRLAGDAVEASSLAGSAPRGGTPRADATLAANLVNSAKDRAEHAMVRDALVDALGELCDDVVSRDEPALLTLLHVHHLHTAVVGRRRAGHSLLELAGALHATPAVGGAPRDAALAFIRQHEQLDRGWYAAPIGWIGRDAGELAVALRSALIDGAQATLFAGCGIVAASDPARELAESQVKLRPMQLALAATLGHHGASATASAAASGCDP